MLVWEGTTWMNDSLTQRFLENVIGRLIFRERRLLVWDSFRCHLSNSMKEVLKKLKIDTAVVPGGCTPFVQPADVSWNKPFKKKIQDLHDEWLSSGNLELTAGGKFRPTPILTYLQWVTEAWDEIGSELIKHSFRACGISLPVDGSNDDEIHVFKSDGQCSIGREKLRSAMETDAGENVPLLEEVPEAHKEDDSGDSEYDTDEDEM